MDFSSFVARRGSENGAKTVVCHKHDGERKRMLSLLSEFSKYSLAELSYKAPLQKFYRENDPTNSMNPGIGKTSKRKNWQEVK
ncbi:TPA: hypothetical protein JWI70_002615 [Escherichia coli]|nr:hypothetical protein [Escherichia coli]EEQ6523694.1 hypothetical protein [Escherichia coli]EEQ9686284.1 hypothetical protein [Escherichia coli]EEQ9772896.1 hypothetical protein [Escherichia coli]EES1812431.1 hypothetical protein [Escherichia coli]